MILGCPEAVRRRNAAGGRGGLSSLVMKVKEFCVGIRFSYVCFNMRLVLILIPA